MLPSISAVNSTVAQSKLDAWEDVAARLDSHEGRTPAQRELDLAAFVDAIEHNTPVSTDASYLVGTTADDSQVRPTMLSLEELVVTEQGEEAIRNVELLYQTVTGEAAPREILELWGGLVGGALGNEDAVAAVLGAMAQQYGLTHEAVVGDNVNNSALATVRALSANVFGSIPEADKSAEQVQAEEAFATRLADGEAPLAIAWEIGALGLANASSVFANSVNSAVAAHNMGAVSLTLDSSAYQNGDSQFFSLQAGGPVPTSLAAAPTSDDGPPMPMLEVAAGTDGATLTVTGTALSDDISIEALTSTEALVRVNHNVYAVDVGTLGTNAALGNLRVEGEEGNDHIRFSAAEGVLVGMGTITGTDTAYDDGVDDVMMLTGEGTLLYTKDGDDSAVFGTAVDRSVFTPEVLKLTQIAATIDAASGDTAYVEALGDYIAAGNDPTESFGALLTSVNNAFPGMPDVASMVASQIMGPLLREITRTTGNPPDYTAANEMGAAVLTMLDGASTETVELIAYAARTDMSGGDTSHLAALGGYIAAGHEPGVLLAQGRLALDAAFPDNADTVQSPGVPMLEVLFEEMLQGSENFPNVAAAGDAMLAALQTENPAGAQLLGLASQNDLEAGGLTTVNAISAYITDGNDVSSLTAGMLETGALVYPNDEEAAASFAANAARSIMATAITPDGGTVEDAIDISNVFLTTVAAHPAEYNSLFTIAGGIDDDLGATQYTDTLMSFVVSGRDPSEWMGDLSAVATTAFPNDAAAATEFSSTVVHNLLAISIDAPERFSETDALGAATLGALMLAADEDASAPAGTEASLPALTGAFAAAAQQADLGNSIATNIFAHMVGSVMNQDEGATGENAHWNTFVTHGYEADLQNSANTIIALVDDTGLSYMSSDGENGERTISVFGTRGNDEFAVHMQDNNGVTEIAVRAADGLGDHLLQLGDGPVTIINATGLGAGNDEMWVNIDESMRDAQGNLPTVNAQLFGGSGQDYLQVTGAADVRVFGGDNDDTLVMHDVASGMAAGGTGADTIYGQNSGTVSLHGGAGNDTLDASNNVTANMHGGDGDDSILAVAGADASGAINIMGGSGNDEIFADGGATVNVNAGAGHDVVGVNVPYPDGNIAYTSGDVAVTGGSGDDTIDVRGATTARLSGNAGNDMIFADGIDRATITGGPGNDAVQPTNLGAGSTIAGSDGFDSVLADSEYTSDTVENFVSTSVEQTAELTQADEHDIGTPPTLTTADSDGIAALGATLAAHTAASPEGISILASQLRALAESSPDAAIDAFLNLPDVVAFSIVATAANAWDSDRATIEDAIEDAGNWAAAGNSLSDANATAVEFIGFYASVGFPQGAAITADAPVGQRLYGISESIVQYADGIAVPASSRFTIDRLLSSNPMSSIAHGTMGATMDGTDATYAAIMRFDNIDHSDTANHQMFEGLAVGGLSNGFVRYDSLTGDVRGKYGPPSIALIDTPNGAQLQASIVDELVQAGILSPQVPGAYADADGGAARVIGSQEDIIGFSLSSPLLQDVTDALWPNSDMGTDHDVAQGIWDYLQLSL